MSGSLTIVFWIVFVTVLLSLFLLWEDQSLFPRRLESTTTFNTYSYTELVSKMSEREPFARSGHVASQIRAGKNEPFMFKRPHMADRVGRRNGTHYRDGDNHEARRLQDTGPGTNHNRRLATFNTYSYTELVSKMTEKDPFERSGHVANQIRTGKNEPFVFKRPHMADRVGRRNGTHHRDGDNHEARRLQNKRIIRIVVYDVIRGYLNWMNPWFIEAASSQCDTKCVLSDKKQDLPLADVVVFHAPTRGQTSPTYPQRRPPNALYALVSLEQPKYAKILNDKKELQNFDVLMTYSLKAAYADTDIPNIPITYYPLNILSPNAVMQPPRPFKDKTGYGTGVGVALFTSNCHAAGASERYAYVQELMNHIEVHSYGKCFNNRKEPEMPDDPAWPPIAQRRARKVKVLSQYKFYLAFENLAVEDYVSEKVFEGLFAGTVPIYRGTNSIHKFMPSNDSFIDANHMAAPQLAALLKSLLADEAQYNRYFQFKSRPLAPAFQEMALMSYTHPNVLCRLCNYVATARPLQ